MAIDENILFQEIYAKNPDKPIEYIMTEVAKAQHAYAQAQKQLENFGEAKPLDEIEAKQEASESVQTEKSTDEAKHKRLTKRSLKFNPNDAIKDDHITCCICGKELKILSATHLNNHGTTPSEYKKLCGYDANQKLASYKTQEQQAENAKKAQAARSAKSKNQETNN